MQTYGRWLLMDRNLALEFVRVTEAAAISSSKWMGRGDSDSADRAAVEEMRARMNSLDFEGRIVIGEGERDEAPMLYIGEKVGRGAKAGGEGGAAGLPKFDIAVDPLEGTTITSKGQPNAISVLAAAPAGRLLHAPDTYMDKIAVGPRAVGAIDLDASVKDNVHAVADKLGKAIDDMTVVILERDRHKELIEQVRKTGARIMLIGDGDVSGAIVPSLESRGIDMLMGIGGAPEGVISAAALKCLGGEIQGRLKWRNEKEKERAKDMGVGSGDLDRKLTMDDMAKGDTVLFVATGVTDGTLLKGVHFTSTGCETHSMVMRSRSGTVRFIHAIHKFHVKRK
ncbi:MAG: class II fructose-bisphosphatase [Candidatus Burarchaeum sp.]|nr:class II fructose-bisphosphatase [Candidatus Burarchaeum sp.]MDO8339356.1 class II fructose-bisphosphatase [Candidatus Burarchaeum sp.]